MGGLCGLPLHGLLLRLSRLKRGTCGSAASNSRVSSRLEGLVANRPFHGESAQPTHPSSKNVAGTTLGNPPKMGA